MVAALEGMRFSLSRRGIAREIGWDNGHFPPMSAFEQLLAEGYIESRVGSGTFVSAAVLEERSLQMRAAVAKLRRAAWP
jgi:hypothetical protein